ncbi:MAG TPA: sialidase family protein, partial [Candidatus Solibacter sp.]|nr:sialidase family protein [Candidatus Solibacter sp.]
MALPPGVTWSGSIHFADSRNGWVSATYSGSGLTGDSRLLVTRDGGQTWATSLGPSSHGGWVLSRRAGPPAVAWGPALGSYDPNQQVPRLWVSRDGGASWSSVQVPAVISSFRDVDVLGGTIYGLAEIYQKSSSDPFHALFTSSDWGQTWQQLGTLDQLAARLSLVDGQHAFVFGGLQTNSLMGTPSNPRSALETSADGGHTWSYLNLPANVACRFGDFF